MVAVRVFVVRMMGVREKSDVLVQSIPSSSSLVVHLGPIAGYTQLFAHVQATPMVLLAQVILHGVLFLCLGAGVHTDQSLVLQLKTCIC